jgi:hypothetical protein
MSQVRRHISIVSVEKLEKDAIGVLCDSPLVASLAVAPTHFGKLLSDGSIEFDKRSKNLETIGSKLSFNSVQGIFYALDAEDEVFGITKISLSHDRMLVASVTLDDAVKLIDISNLKQR